MRLRLGTKIFLALTLLPSVTLLVFLAQAIRVFEADKVAYIYDSSLLLSRVRAEQIRSRILSLQKLGANLALTADFEKQTLHTVGQSSFDSEKEILEFALIEKTASDFVARASASKVAPSFVVIPEIEQWLKAHSSSAVALGVHPVHRDQAILSIKIENEALNRTFYSFLVLKIEVLSQVSTSSAADVSIVDKSGASLLRQFRSDQGLKPKDIELALTQNGFKSGSVEVTPEEGYPQLVSVAEIGISDLFVVTALSKESAVSAMKSIALQGVAVCIALIGSTIMVSVVLSKGLTKSINALAAATKKVASGDFAVYVQPQSNDEVGDLTASFNTMSSEVGRLMSETAIKARMEAELKTAKTVQETLFPQPHVELGPITISGFYEPASECGGDWWFHFQDDEFTYVFIGDVTGHGAPAALLTSAARSTVSIAQKLGIKSPKEIVSLVNEALHSTSQGKLMMTFVALRIEKSSGKAVYALASHENPILIKAIDRPVKKESIVFLTDGNCPRLGERSDTVFCETEIQLSPGDYLFLYTDGARDTENKQGKELGERRMLKLLAEAITSTDNARGSLQVVVDKVQEWSQGTPLNDDITMVLLKWGKSDLAKRAS